MLTLDRQLSPQETDIIANMNRKLSPAEMEEMFALAKELQVPLQVADIFMEVKEPESEFVLKHAQGMNSWTRNAYNIVLSQIAGTNMSDVGSFGAGYMSVKDTGGTIRASATDPICIVYCSPLYGDLTEGIVVGTGTNAEDFEDYVLQTMIAHGSSAGELLAYAQQNPIRYWNVGTRVFTWVQKRHFYNDSGGSITVNEVGLIGYCSGCDAMTARDKLGAGVAVADGNTLRVTYTWTSSALGS